MKSTASCLGFPLGAMVASSLLLAGCAHMSPLHKAAMAGDLVAIDRYVANGIPVNRPDEQGNTPLHLAYYHGHPEAVEKLKAYGADLTIRNKDGCTPLDMARIAEAEHLIQAGARLLDEHAAWSDSHEGRRVYDRLADMEHPIVTKSLVRQVLKPTRRLQVLFLAIKLGIPGSEEQLAHVLDAFGDKQMAEDYLNSGSQALYAAGERWARARSAQILSGPGSHRAAWGRF